MRDLILFGACDRFNFGDMMMPLAIGRWMARARPGLTDRYRLRCASLSVSDMSGRDCLPTEAILDVCASAGRDAVILVAGGEVTGAKRAGLFMHNSRDDREHAQKRKLRRNDPEAFGQMLRAEFGDIWEYPYLPPRDCLPEGGRIFYSAIGGDLAGSDQSDPRLRRLTDADYISVRDTRLAGIGGAHLAPCAVSLIAGGYFEDFDTGKPPCDTPYFVVQCVHNPGEIDPDALADQIRALAAASGLRVCLVPLAYASGHSDHKALAELQSRLGDLAVTEASGSLSGILTAFRHAEFYIGTSLHGTITAMACGIPWFPFKKSIRKLGAYLAAWTVPDLAVLCQVRTPSQLSAIPWQDCAAMRPALQRNAQRLSDLAAQNLGRMADQLPVR